MDCALSEELAILSSIYGEDVEIVEGTPVKVTMQILPSTADDQSAKHVWVTIAFEIPSDYPSESPKVQLTRSRGLNQEQEKTLLEKIGWLCDDKLGTAMLFDAIDVVKEYLTENNHPSLECSICLEMMTREVAFVKTNCFHYFHPWCLSDYLKAAKETQDENVNPSAADSNDAWCPICRENLDLNMEFLDSHERPSDCCDPPLNTKVELSAEFRKFQQQMQGMMDKQRAQGGLIDANCNSNVVIDVSAVSRPAAESSVEHSADEVDSQMTQLKESAIIPEKDDVVPKEEKVETPINSDMEDKEADQLVVPDNSNDSSKVEVPPNARLRGNSRNLNSSYPVNARKSSKDFEVRSRNLSSSFSSATSETSAIRIDHKYHDGRWRPRKKHDFEIRAELLEKSQSLDEEKRNALNGDGDKDKSAGVLKTCSDETDVNTKRDGPLKASDQNKESKHVTIHQTASNPPSGNSETKTTRRIRQKPPPSLSVKSNRSLTFNQPYSDKDYYGYAYDQSQGQPEDWYYQPSDGSQAGNFYNSAEFYRNRHSYHGNSYRGKTGYQGRSRHKNSSGHYPPQHYFDASSSYDWEHWRSNVGDRRMNLSGSFSAQPSPKIYPRTRRAKYYSSSERQSFEDESVDSSTSSYNGHFQSGRSDSLASSGNGYLVTPNSPMLQPMPVLPAPSSADSANSDCVFTYYNGPPTTSAPAFSPYPMFE